MKLSVYEIAGLAVTVYTNNAILNHKRSIDFAIRFIGMQRVIAFLLQTWYKGSKFIELCVATSPLMPS